MKITRPLLESLGAKLVSCPTRLGKRHITDDVEVGKVLLVAIVYTPFGEHFKEISSDMTLRDLRSTPMGYDCFELNRAQIESLKEQVRA